MAGKSGVEAANLLCEGEWLPVTSTVLFVNASVDRCVEELVGGVRGRYLEQRFGFAPFTSREVASPDLPGLLATLLPLEIPEERRSLFLQTSNPRWTAMFTSAWRGLDPGSPLAWFGQGRLESVSVAEVPHRPRLSDGTATYGYRQILMYEIPPTGDPIPHTLGVRSTGATKWEVDVGAREFPLGNIWDPDERLVRNRFTHSHLTQMCSRMGLYPFDEDFYAPDGVGVLVERTDLTPPDWPRISLAQARGEEPAPF